MLNLDAVLHHCLHLLERERSVRDLRLHAHHKVESLFEGVDRESHEVGERSAALDERRVMRRKRRIFLRDLEGLSDLRTQLLRQNDCRNRRRSTRRSSVF